MAKKSTWLALALGIGTAVAAGVAASIAITKKHQEEDAEAEAEFTPENDPEESVQKISGEDRNYVSIPHPAEETEETAAEGAAAKAEEPEDAPVSQKEVSKEELD